MEQVGSIVPASIKLAKMATVGTAKDLWKGEGVPGAIAWGATGGLLGKHPTLSRLRHGETTNLGKEIGKGLIQSTLDLGDPTKWRQDTAMQAINLLGLRSRPCARRARRSSRSRSRSRTRSSTAARALRLGVKESFNPGFAAAQGLEGGIAPRVIRGQVRDRAGADAVAQPGRARRQRAVDVVSEAIDRRTTVRDRPRPPRARPHGTAASPPTPRPVARLSTWRTSRRSRTRSRRPSATR